MRFRRDEVPTMVDITPQMLERAAVALMAEEAQGRLTNIYGAVTLDRARRHARAALEAGT